ncbi:hypothetical protein B0H19DRAFT_1377709 [Mycena capillaripes]|nr:hypothetical protein B0H19DRAFT_1377709 [Mycena capillaripes]
MADEKTMRRDLEKGTSAHPNGEAPSVSALRHKPGFIFKMLGWPVAIILSQITLQGLGWGFFGAVRARGQISLPFHVALWVRDNAHLVTLIATMISTLFAGCSSFLFSYAIRKSLSLYLSRPMRLATLGASVSISMRKMIFHRRHWKWPLVSVIFLILTGFQTSGWSTLLTPITIVVPTPLFGSELDLSSPNINLSETDYGLCSSSGGLYGSIAVDRSESGYAAAKAAFGYPAVLTLMDQSFNISTGGILAALLNTEDSGQGNGSVWYANQTWIPATTRFPLAAHGISTNYSMVQQGFTADVSCSVQTLGNLTSPSLQLTNELINDQSTGLTAETSIMRTTISSDCPSDGLMNITHVYTDSQQSYLMMLGCGPMAGTADNYTLIFVTGGAYNWIPPMVCTIAPKITTLRVEYAGVINAKELAASKLIPTKLVGKFAVYTLQDMLYNSQGIISSVMGDQFTSVASEPHWGNDNSSKMMEEYIRGVVEYSGSVFRACLSAKDYVFLDGVPLNMTIPMAGMHATESRGWAAITGPTVLVLLPGTIVALATICVVLTAVIRHDGALPTHPFDPSKPLHLIAVAAAGGLGNAFRGIEEKELGEAQRTKVVLSWVPGHGPTLVRTDECEHAPFLGASESDYASLQLDS